MNFGCLMELVQQYQYEEIRIIGRDALLMGKQAHFIAMVREEDQTKLFILVQKEEEPKLLKEKYARVGQEVNRDFMKECVSHRLLNVKGIIVNGVSFTTGQAQCGELNTNDLDSLLLLAGFAAAGWRLPEGHLFWREEWDKIELLRCQMDCPCTQLPEWENARLEIVWNTDIRRHLIEKQVRLAVGAADDPECEMQISFSITAGDGKVQEGICYINGVVLEDPWKEHDARLADPEYQKKMLEYMTPEEFADLKKTSNEAMEQICPRGMYLPVVQYECTLDLNLQFYMSEYLNSMPDYSGRSVMVMLGVKNEEELGTHGLKLKGAWIQSAVEADVKEICAELFEANETLPEWKEEVVFI